VLEVREVQTFHRRVSRGGGAQERLQASVEDEHKHHSRNDYKHKNKSERMRKSNGHKKKNDRAMVTGASDIDLSSCYTLSSSSSEEEECDRCKDKKQTNKNSNGLCFAAQGLNGMAQRSRRKKSRKDDSDLLTVETSVAFRSASIWITCCLFHSGMIQDIELWIGSKLPRVLHLIYQSNPT
jgi:hypothetical protein